MCLKSGTRHHVHYEQNKELISLNLCDVGKNTWLTPDQKCEKHISVFQDSVGLPGTDDNLGERVYIF